MLFRWLIIFLLFPIVISAQEPEESPLSSSFSIAYENDLLTASLQRPTDYYYTGGTFIEFNLPCLRKNLVSRILLSLIPVHGSDVSFGISLNSLGFTPTSIKSDSILLGDRPFAGTIYAGLNRVSCYIPKRILLTSRLDIGAIGPVAFGYETQKFIHAHTNNPEPHGWQFQIANDVYLNYSLRMDKSLLLKRNIFEISGYGVVNAGTVYTNAEAGLRVRAGKLQSFFTPGAYADHFYFWVYADGECKVIGRDATLQGGLFNRSSLYTIDRTNMKRAVFILSTGVVVAYHKFRMEYFNTFLTPEFSGGRKHAWGHIGFTLLF